MSRNSPICIVEYDDPDMNLLSEAIHPRLLKLGLPSDRYSLTYRSSDHWEISDGDSLISCQDIDLAPFIWYRRWKTSPPAAAVAAPTDLGLDAAAFIERQWETTLMTLLAASYEATASKWSRAPLRRDNKIHTNEILESLGLLPETHIALTPPHSDVEWVWKPLDSDQSVGDGRAAAIAVTAVDQNVRQPCPGFYQLRVKYETELRVAYVFGEVCAVSQQPEWESEIVDKRYVDMIRRPFRSHQLAEQAIRISHEMQLNMFTADVLMDGDGSFWWIDVNQDGLFCAADSPDGYLLSAVRNQFSRGGGAE